MSKYLAIAAVVLLFIAVGTLESRETSRFGPSFSVGPVQLTFR